MPTLSATVLTNTDDLVRSIVLDALLNIQTRKMNFSGLFLKKLSAKNYTTVMENFKSSNSDMTSTINALLAIAHEDGLLAHLNLVEHIDFVKAYIQWYLKLFSSDSPVAVEVCTRYTGDKHAGLKITARKKLRENFKLLHAHKVILTKEEKKKIHQNENDFSISTVNSSTHVLLGTVALANHDCSPNSKFARSRRGYCIQTIKPIEIGEELLVFYGPHYFEDNNSCCECHTCENKKQGSFSVSQGEHLHEKEWLVKYRDIIAENSLIKSIK